MAEKTKLTNRMVLEAELGKLSSEDYGNVVIEIDCGLGLWSLICGQCFAGHGGVCIVADEDGADRLECPVTLGQWLDEECADAGKIRSIVATWSKR